MMKLGLVMIIILAFIAHRSVEADKTSATEIVVGYIVEGCGIECTLCTGKCAYDLYTQKDSRCVSCAATCASCGVMWFNPTVGAVIRGGIVVHDLVCTLIRWRDVVQFMHEAGKTSMTEKVVANIASRCGDECAWCMSKCALDLYREKDARCGSCAATCASCGVTRFNPTVGAFMYGGTALYSFCYE